VEARGIAVRAISVAACLLTVAAACSSSHNTSNAPTTTTAVASSSTATTDPNLTPNSIPYVVGEKIGLPNGWLVTVVKVEKAYSNPNLKAVGTGRQYIAVDLIMQNQGPAAHSVNANALFALVDSAHKSHYVVPEPGKPNGIDGEYPAGTTHSGRIVFAAPTDEDLGLILYGPKIGTQVSYFAIIPPTVPQGQ
jgi:hypothetical protein